jgi:hypothetical protein
MLVELMLFVRHPFQLPDRQFVRGPMSKLLILTVFDPQTSGALGSDGAMNAGYQYPYRSFEAPACPHRFDISVAIMLSQA